jgi:aryl-alcohol dehydrogenase-like predicted oxidoreductase
MEQRILGGETGVPVSALCLGTMFFGTLVDEATSFAVLDRFLEAGGTFIDTANNYSYWVGGTGDESELLLGRWLASRGVRDRIVLASKVGARPGRGAPREGLSAEAIKSGVEGSLRRLGVDRIDVYYAHIDDPATPVSETLQAFAGLVEAGVVGMLGCSNHTAGRVASARALSRDHDWPGYRCVQQRASYLVPRPDADFGVQRVLDRDLVDYARAEPDLTLLAYSPLLGGAYTNPAKALPAEYDHPGTQHRLAVLHDVAAELGATSNQVVLAWLLRSDPAVLPVIGASRVEQLEDSLGAVDLRLSGEHRSRLDAA